MMVEHASGYVKNKPSSLNNKVMKKIKAFLLMLKSLHLSIWNLLRCLVAILLVTRLLVARAHPKKSNTSKKPEVGANDKKVLCYDE